PKVRSLLHRFPLLLRWRLPHRMGGRRMSAKVKLSALEAREGHLDLKLRSQVYCAEPVQHVKRLPAQRRRSRHLRAGLSIDISVHAINQLVHAMWVCGGFQVRWKQILPKRLRAILGQVQMESKLLRPPTWAWGGGRYPLTLWVRDALFSWRIPSVGRIFRVRASFALGVRLGISPEHEWSIVCSVRPRFLRVSLSQNGRVISAQERILVETFLRRAIPYGLRRVVTYLPKEIGRRARMSPWLEKMMQRLVLLPRSFGFDGVSIHLGGEWFVFGRSRGVKKASEDDSALGRE
ncbi:MAG: hypothetical protein AAGJ35_02765, partial [Myxococcota bacterium]